MACSTRGLNAMGQESILFLLNAQWATFWVIFVSTWAQMGFYTLILLAGLQAIPAELYEAGQIDGAGSWASFRSYHPAAAHADHVCGAGAVAHPRRAGL